MGTIRDARAVGNGARPSDPVPNDLWIVPTEFRLRNTSERE